MVLNTPKVSMFFAGGWGGGGAGGVAEYLGLAFGGEGGGRWSFLVASWVLRNLYLGFLKTPKNYEKLGIAKVTIA
jgi:hypothetical protein